jgi:hypothetical protein
MGQTQNSLRHIEAVKGSREAYRVGLSLQMFYGWAHSVEVRKDSTISLPKYREFPFTAMGNPTNASLKDRFISRTLNALRRLALMHAVDPVALVEMHRICASLEREFAELLQSFKRKDRRGVRRCLRGVRYNRNFSGEVGDRLFVGCGEQLLGWYRLGALLAKIRCRLVLGDTQRTIPRVMTDFIELGRELLPDAILGAVVSLYDPRARYIGISNREEPGGKLLLAILKLDKSIYKYLTEPDSAEPYIVFDDKNRSVTYFRTAISFDDLPVQATGGLNFFRVFVQRPGIPMSATQLIKESDSVVEANQVTVYLSRFRKALKEKIAQKNKHLIHSMSDSKEAEYCFILPDRKARAQDISKDTYYKLELPPDRVKYIAPK